MLPTKQAPRLLAITTALNPASTTQYGTVHTHGSVPVDLYNAPVRVPAATELIMLSSWLVTLHNMWLVVEYISPVVNVHMGYYNSIFNTHQEQQGC